MLTVENLFVSYGKFEAIHGISFELKKGEILSIIGANGAGKTTLLNSISGLLKKKGKILLYGNPISNAPSKVVKAGIVQVPEGRKIFAAHTVEENLKVGAYLNKNSREVNRMIEKQYSTFPILKERRYQHAGDLSGGEQQMLAICRGLMAKPAILLLDEPSLGLAPKIVSDVFNVIKKIQESGVTILLVEQNAVKALSVADHGLVLENGKIAFSGTGKELLKNPSVSDAYLGTKKR